MDMILVDDLVFTTTEGEQYAVLARFTLGHGTYLLAAKLDDGGMVHLDTMLILPDPSCKVAMKQGVTFITDNMAGNIARLWKVLATDAGYDLEEQV